MNREIRIVMKVAEEGDAEARQSGRPTPKRNFFANNSRTVWLYQHSIGGNASQASGRCDADKFSPGNREKRQSVSDPYFACAARSLHFQHNPNPRIRDMPRARSETESGLQLDLAVGGSTRRERSSLKRIGNVEQPGTKNRVGIRRVHVVEDVAGVHSQCEIVTSVGIARDHRGPAAE